MKRNIVNALKCTKYSCCCNKNSVITFTFKDMGNASIVFIYGFSVYCLYKSYKNGN